MYEQISMPLLGKMSAIVRIEAILELGTLIKMKF